jgi:uncharacterized protein YceH (UPF0502 family)
VPPILTLHEQRVLGCLLEKEKLTPESYPLTLNSLKLACNQKTSREPVLELTEGEVSSALGLLKGKELVFTRTDARASKYNHTLERVAGLNSGQQAIITLLLLRGPQTAGELRGRSGRLHEFGTPAEVEEGLESLANHEGGAWVKRLERRPGEKEARWAHLLGGEVTEVSVAEVIAAERADEDQALAKRVEDLEKEVAALAQAVKRLEERLEKGSGHFDGQA